MAGAGRAEVCARRAEAELRDAALLQSEGADGEYASRRARRQIPTGGHGHIAIDPAEAAELAAAVHVDVAADARSGIGRRSANHQRAAIDYRLVVVGGGAVQFKQAGARLHQRGGAARDRAAKGAAFERQEHAAQLDLAAGAVQGGQGLVLGAGDIEDAARIDRDLGIGGQAAVRAQLERAAIDDDSAGDGVGAVQRLRAGARLGQVPAPEMMPP